jgi:phosphoribosyl-AMP cyclohydrolase
MPAIFASPPPEKAILEADGMFTPRFGKDGLVTAIVVDDGEGSVLMVAHMNAEALALTLQTGIAHYWSRSRSSLWKKGETSGNFQRIVRMQTDCDQDAILLRVTVEGDGMSCHTGAQSCFYRDIVWDAETGSAAVKHVPKNHRSQE